MRIFAYYKDHIPAIALVIVLLVGQAFADLMLPNLTSQIVDVGIQQSGVEHVAVEKMSDASHRMIAALLPTDDEQLFGASYEPAADGTWALTPSGRAQIDKLDQLLSHPLIMIHHPGAGADSLASMMREYEAGKLDKETLLQRESEVAGAEGNPNDELIHQQAIAAARAEYEAIGYDLTSLQFGYLIQIGLMMLGLAALAMALAIAVDFIASRVGARIGFSLRSKLFRRVVSFTEEEIASFSAASLITRGTNDIQLIQMVCIMLLRMVIYAPILAVGGIIMVMVTNAAMGWVIVVAIVAVFVVIGLVFSITLPKFRIIQGLIDKVNLVAREMLSGISVVRAFEREAYEEARFDEASSRLMDTQLFTNRVMSFMMPCLMLIMNATSVGIVWVGGGYIDTGIIQTGDLIAFITYAMVIIMGFLMLGMISIMLPRAAVAAGRVDEVINRRPSIVDPDLAHECHLSTGNGQGAEIVFEHVSFSYPASDEKVLDDVSFVAKPGETLALVGSNGSGKSTVIKLLERFYDVSEGRVLIDGVDIRDLSQAELRAQLAYVPQRAFLFSGTIASNLEYGDAQVDEERMERALSVAQALDFVNAEQQGVDTEVSQGGMNFSGGQRQRLAIARALTRQARAYLFDDSFSALDYKTDRALRRDLLSQLGSATRLIVAQRVATIRDADLIVVLDEGQVVGKGRHEELLKSCPAYYEIAASQLSAQELGGGELL